MFREDNNEQLHCALVGHRRIQKIKEKSLSFHIVCGMSQIDENAEKFCQFLFFMRACLMRLNVT